MIIKSASELSLRIYIATISLESLKYINTILSILSNIFNDYLGELVFPDRWPYWQTELLIGWSSIDRINQREWSGRIYRAYNQNWAEILDMQILDKSFLIHSKGCPVRWFLELMIIQCRTGLLLGFWQWFVFCLFLPYLHLSNIWIFEFCIIISIKWITLIG